MTDNNVHWSSTLRTADGAVDMFSCICSLVHSHQNLLFCHGRTVSFDYFPFQERKNINNIYTIGYTVYVHKHVQITKFTSIAYLYQLEYMFRIIFTCRKLISRQNDSMGELEGFCQQPSTSGDVYGVPWCLCYCSDLIVILLQN